MGRRGPPPQPENVLRMRGTMFPCKERAQAVAPVEDDMKPPPGMPAKVKTVWKDRVKVYGQRGMDLSGCGPALEQYCYLLVELRAQWRSGEPPSASMLARLKDFAVQFYDTPASKTVTAAPRKDENPFAKFAKSGT